MNFNCVLIVNHINNNIINIEQNNEKKNNNKIIIIIKKKYIYIYNKKLQHMKQGNVNLITLH